MWLGSWHAAVDQTEDYGIKLQLPAPPGNLLIQGIAAPELK